jgi:Domain of Unknown Function (DUF1080)
MLRCEIVLTAFALLAAPLFAAEDGFTSLFDGKSLDGWTLVGKTNAGYIIEDGNLVCPEKGGGNLMSNKEYANFVLRFEFKMRADTNNGVGIRSPLNGHVATLGMEIQIIDISGPLYRNAKLRPEQLHGAVYDVIPARTGFFKPLGEWNVEEITANGRRIKVVLNGVIILDVDLDIVKEPEVLKKHPGLARTSGRIGFLGHNSWIALRNIRIKELP